MRCPKCGYVSFDYLERCQKCQTDLTGERDRLRLPPFRPDPLSLIELSERAAQVKEKETQKAREVSGKAEKDKEIDLSLDLSTPPQKVSQAKGTPPSFDLEKELELTLEGLEIKINSEK